MFLHNPINGAKVGKNEQFFSKHEKSRFLKFGLLIFIYRKKGNCKLLFTLMKAHHNQKMKELVYPSPNIVHC